MTEVNALDAAKDTLFVFGVVLASGTLGGALARASAIADVVVYLWWH
ncbi:MAG: hypothetical protein HC809_07065, partial [Gammaproteobacteria bacterium]|nr:hypothetical protein [Gammaproteobacteria bacterium]